MASLTTKQLAYAAAKKGIKALADWLDGNPEEKAFAILNIFHALELCIRLRSGLGQRAEFHKVAEEVGLGTRATPYSDWVNLDPALEEFKDARGSTTHFEFSDKVTDTTLGRCLGFLFAEVELALQKHLEIAVPEAWQAVCRIPAFANGIEWAVRNRLPALIGRHTYLACPQCSRSLFNSELDRCRVCGYEAATFLCEYHNAITWAPKRDYLRTVDTSRPIEVCEDCFRALGPVREAEISRTAAYVQAVCPSCTFKCLDMNHARCLLCSSEHNELKHGRSKFKRCAACRRLFPRASFAGRCCTSCRAVKLRCVVDKLEYSLEYLGNISGVVYCRRCAKAFARCTVCLQYSNDLATRTLQAARALKWELIDSRKAPRSATYWPLTAFVDGVAVWCDKCDVLISEAMELLDAARTDFFYAVAEGRISTRGLSAKQIDTLITAAATKMGPRIPWAQITDDVLDLARAHTPPYEHETDLSYEDETDLDDEEEEEELEEDGE